MNAEELLLKMANTIVAGLQTTTNKAVKSALPKMAKANREQMLSHQTNTGGLIQPDYSTDYAIYKGFNTPNLKDTGNFQRGLFAKVMGTEIEFNSRDWKAEPLWEKYGEDIFGLNDKNANEIFTNYVFPKINTFINKSAERYL